MTENENDSSETQEIYYRPFTKKLFFLVLFVLLLSELVIYRIHYKELESAGLVFGSFRFLLLSTVPLGIFIRMWIVIRPRIFSRFRIDGNSLFISLGKKENEVHFSQIKSLRPSLLPAKFLGGFRITLNSGKSLFFSSIIKNEFLLLQQIQKYSPNLLEGKSFQLLIEESKQTEKYWQHIYKRAKNIKYLAFRYLLSPAAPIGIVYLQLRDEVSTPSVDSLPIAETVSYLFIGLFLLNFLIGVGISHSLEKHTRHLENKKQKQLYLLSECLHFLFQLGLGYLIAKLSLGA